MHSQQRQRGVLDAPVASHAKRCNPRGPVQDSIKLVVFGVVCFALGAVTSTYSVLGSPEAGAAPHRNPHKLLVTSTAPEPSTCSPCEDGGLRGGSAASGSPSSPRVLRRMSPQGRFFQIEREDIRRGREVPADGPRVLVLTPLKNTAKHLDTYFGNLANLTFPRHQMSLGFLDSDSTDATWSTVHARVSNLTQHYRRVTLVQHDFGLDLPREVRHEEYLQVIRRHVLARGRNHLLSRALVDEDWVLWVDSDVYGWPRDILSTLLAANRTIVSPNCVMSRGGVSYDLNSWAAPWMSNASLHTHGSWQRDAAATALMRLSEAVSSGAGKKTSARSWAGYLPPLAPLTVDALTACLSLVTGRLNRPGPSLHLAYSDCASPLGRPSAFRGWESLVPAWARGDPEATQPQVIMEGYARTPTRPLYKLRHVGDIVELGGVGGAMLLVHADLHRDGLVFPPFPYRQRIETEGLAAMARDMGHRAWGMPHVEVLHA